MKQTYKKISKALVILATVLLVLVGCSDMMVKIGDIVLKIEAEDTIRTYVETYTVTGSLQGSKSSSLSFEDVKPDQEVLVPNIAPGKWTFTVVAFDAAKKQIGTGTTAIILAEGQKVDLRVPVLFDPLPLGIGEPLFPETLDKVYDGTTTLTVTAGALSGLVSGYEGVRAEARATYADKGAGKDKAVTVSYDLVYDDATITNKYDSLADNTAYTGDIYQRQLTISAPIFPTTKNKEYDGTNTLAVTAGDFTNLVEGDDVTVTAHAGYSDKNAEENKVITITYTISGSDAANYITPVTDTSYSGSIAKKPLTFTVAAKDRKYNGDTTAEGAITLEGMVPSDAKAVGATGTFAFSDKNVGSEKTVSVTAITLTGDEKDNYSLTESEATTTATISKKTFDMSGIGFEDVSRIYNNEAFELAISGTLPEGVSVSYSGNTGNIHVGTYEVTASFSVDEANHEAIDAMVATLTIEKKVLTREGTYLKLSKPYDKNRTALFTLDQEKSGKVRGDKINVSIEAYYSNASVGPNSITVTYALTGDNIRNYTRPENYIEPAGVILPIQLTVESPSLEVTSKTYDGTTALGTTSVTPTGVLPGDAVALTATATYRDRNVGTAKAILVTYALDAPNTNYLAPKASTVYEGVITKKVLFVKPNSTQIAPSKIYDGTLSAKVLDAGTPIGVASDDNVVLGATASYQDKNVLLEGDTPQPKPVTVLYSLSGLHADNYTLEEPTNSTDYSATITRKALGVYANTTQVDTGKFYDGTRKALVRSKGILDGLVSGDDVTLSTEALYASADAGANNQITVSYTLDGDDKNNYTKPVDNTRIVGTISKRALSIVAGSTSISTERPYNRGTLALVTHKGTLEGVVGLEDVTLSTSASYEDADAGENKKITVSYALLGTAVANYLAPASYTIFTGTITPLQLGIGEPSLSAPSKIYDGSDSVSGTITQGALTGLLDGDRGTVTLQATATYLNKDVGGDKAVTVHYTLDESSTNAVNYIAPGDSILYTGSIAKKPLSVATDTTKLKTERVYDGTTNISVLAVEDLEGVVGNDVVTLSAEASFDDNGDVGKNKPFTVTYKIAGSHASNYSEPISFTSSSGEIKPLRLTISDPRFSNTSKTYDGTKNLSFEQGTLNGVIAKDQSTVAVSATAEYENVDVGVNKKITVSYALIEANTNYLPPVNYTITTGVITPKQLLISNPSFPNTIIKEYDGTDSVVFTMGQDITGLYDDSGVTVTASGEYLDIGIGTNKHIRITYMLTGAKAGNYRAPDSYLTTSGEITKKVLKVGSGTTETTVVSQSKEYDGELSAEVTRHGKPQGLVHNEDVVLTATASYNSKTVIAGKTITVGYSLSGTHAANYTAPDGYTIEAAEITKKQLTVKSGTTKVVTEKLSDEKVDVEVLYPGDLAGIVGNDNVTLGALATYRDAAVGKNKTITVVYSLGGDDAGNYTAPNSNDFLGGKISTGQLTISNPILVKTKIYNSTDECIVFPGTTIGGLVGTDEVKIGAVATFDNKNAGTDKEITVVYSLSGRDADKYDAPDNFVAYDGVIQPKQLSITAPTGFNTDKPYDGTNRVVFTPGTLVGKCSSDVVNVISHGFYISSSVGPNRQIFFNYTLTGADAGNYIRPSYEISEGEITPKVLTIAPGTTLISDKIYDKTDSATVREAGDLLGVVGREKVALSATATYNDVTAGTRNVTVIYSLSGVHADNYISPAVNSTDYTGIISKKQLTVDSQDLITSKVYNGTTAAVIADIDLGGIESGDTVTVSAIANYLTKDALTPSNNITVEYTLGGGDEANYSKPADYTTVGTISQNQLTVDSQNLTTSKVYDGDTTAAIADVVLDGIVLNEDVSINTATATYNSKDTDTANKITVSYTLKGAHSGNYLQPADKQVAGTISKKQLTVDSQTLTTSKVYDGDTTAVISGVVLGGIVANDDVSIHTAIATYNSKDTDTANKITTRYTLKGDDIGNYLKPVDKEIAGTISKKLLTIASQNLSTSKVYDGNTTAAALTNVVLGGIVSGEDVSIHTAIATYNSKDTDTANRITISYTLKGDDIGNYLKPADKQVAGSISKKQLTVTSQTLTTSKVYDGAKTANITDVVLGGIIPGDTVTGSATATYLTKDALTLNNNITVEYTLGGGDEANYSKPINYTTVGTISQKQLTVDSQNLTTSKVYDGDTTAVISGVVLGGIESNDDVSIHTAIATYNSKDTDTANKITTRYTLKGDDIGNYLKPVDKEIAGSISQKQLTIASQALTTSKVYDGATTAAIADVVLGGIVANEDVSIHTAIATYNSKDTDTANKITTRYTLKGDDIGNYLKPVDKEIAGTISQKQLTIASQTLTTSKVYDGNTTAVIADVVLDGIVSDEDVSINTVTATYNTKDTDTANEITVSYTLTGAHSGNYSKPTNYITVGTISQKQLTVSGTQIASYKVYDGNTTAEVIANGTLNGVIGDDIVIVIATANYLDLVASSTPKPITVEYSISGRDKSNYIKPSANTTDFSGTIEVPVGSPIFTPSPGTYTSNQNISLSSSTDGATIRYTTDGSVPSLSNGTIYSAPFSISDDSTIKAIAYKSGYISSNVQSAAYYIRPLGEVTGIVTDTISGLGLGGVSISIEGLPGYSTTTASNGSFSIMIPSGGRYIQFSKTGYTIPRKFVSVGAYLVHAIPQSEIIANENVLYGQLRMVLTWGETPSDLDFYLKTPNSGIVYYGNKVVGGANLDVDDTSAYGPETITITSAQSGTYKCYVHNFSKQVVLPISNAVVRVFDSTGLVETYTVPTYGSGDYWNVFTYTNGRIESVNMIVSSVL